MKITEEYQRPTGAPGTRVNGARSIVSCPLDPGSPSTSTRAPYRRGTTMALVDDIRNEIAELIDSGEEIRGHAQAFIQQAGMDADAAEARGRGEARVQRVAELVTALGGGDAV